MGTMSWSTRESILPTIRRRWLKQYEKWEDGRKFFDGVDVAVVRAEVVAMPDSPNIDEVPSHLENWAKTPFCTVCEERDYRPVLSIEDGCGEGVEICKSCLLEALALIPSSEL